MPKEIWKAIPEFAGYEISNYGHVRSYKRGRGDCADIPQRILQPSGGRYLSVSLCRNGIPHRKHIAHLVLETFVGKRPNGMEVCHNDNDSHNNFLNNLRYDTPANNTADSFQHGSSKLTNEQVIALRQAAAEGISDKELATQYNVQSWVIQMCRCGSTYKRIDGPRTKFREGRGLGLALTEQEIIAMRQAYYHKNKLLKELAAKYNVHISTVSYIVRGARHCHIAGPVSRK